MLSMENLKIHVFDVTFLCEELMSYMIKSTI